MTPRTPDATPAPPMTPERWRAVDAVLQAALACEPAQRAAFVAEACGDDAALRREVESLLDAAPDGDFLEVPAAELAVAPAVPAAPRAVRLAAAVEGRYAIERELARGGMATVHLARDERHGRRVAIKVLRDELSAALGAERFLKEIAVTAALQHPHILPLFDSGSAGGMLWYAMPFADGETLRARLAREGALRIDEAVRLAREVADALEHAHRQGVVHRDVKPENILLQDGHALVADFGIALALQHAGGERITRTGLTLGTPQYMAPEQARGERTIDARADVYALGAVLHEMIAGEPPFAAPSAHAVMSKVLGEAPPSLTARRPEVPPYLDAAVRRALAKRPEERFPSAAAFAAALDAPAPAPSEWDRTGARARTVSVATAAKIAVATLLAGIVLGFGIARYTDIGPTGWRSPEPAAQTSGGASPSTAPEYRPREGLAGEGLTLSLVDRAGQEQQTFDARRPWTPRFSPDGRSVVYGAFGPGRSTSDVFVTELGGATRRLTDDDGDANDPQWSADGRMVAYSLSASGGKDVIVQDAAGGTATVLLRRDGNQFPTDWVRDGSAVLMTDERMGSQDVFAQPTDGTPGRALASTGANETAGRVSPDGRWLAYQSDESGGPEIYLVSYRDPGRRVVVSAGGGVHPVWRGDGRELYYWQGNQLVAAALDAPAGDAPPAVRERTTLFRAPYQGGINAMYDVSPDGQRFVIVVDRQPGAR